MKIKGQNSVGEVLEVNGKNAVVAFGSIKTTIKVERLERTNIVPQKVDSSTKSTFVSNQTQDSMYEKKLNFKQDIDVRGMRGDEALQAVTYFIDDAILVGMSRVRILHGTGTGILRTLIRQYLQTVLISSSRRAGTIILFKTVSNRPVAVQGKTAPGLWIRSLPPAQSFSRRSRQRRYKRFSRGRQTSDRKSVV